MKSFWLLRFSLEKLTDRGHHSAAPEVGGLADLRFASMELFVTRLEVILQLFVA